MKHLLCGEHFAKPSPSTISFKPSHQLCKGSYSYDHHLPLEKLSRLMFRSPKVSADAGLESDSLAPVPEAWPPHYHVAVMREPIHMAD